MKNLIRVFIIAIISLTACSRQQADYNDIIDGAESVMYDNPDSALSLLDVIEPAELKEDSIKAKYYYVVASAHDGQKHLALSDSLISYSAEFYRGKDLERSIKSATLLASYKYRIGEMDLALSRCESPCWWCWR